jgi:hypothetical protein
MQRKRLPLTLPLAAIAFAAFGLTAGSALAAGPSTLCVGGKPPCYATVQAAVDAAKDGDTIKIAPGTYAGGVVIDVSVNVFGAGAQATVIRGGGPVLTITRDANPSGLTVTIKGVTITGGVNNSKPDTGVTFGGGVWIPVEQLPAPPYNSTGATVTISNSVITGNTVTSQFAVPAGDFCGPLPCGFNIGGGIDNGGVLTITDTQISDNTAGTTTSLVSLASGTSGGGIVNRTAGTLVLKRTSVTRNHSTVTPPNGQSAEAGGISSGGKLIMEDSLVSDNAAELSSAFPFDLLGDVVGTASGGIHVSEGGSATIRNTIVRGNRVMATNVSTTGLTVGLAGGIGADATLVLERSVVSDNVVRSVSAGDAIANGGGLEIDGTATIRDTIIAHNSVVAKAGGGAFAGGGGITNVGNLTMERTLVLDNSASATGSGAQIFGSPSTVKGGGIWNGSFDGQTTAHLTLAHSAVLRNSLSAPSSFVIQGGGLYTDFPVTKTATLIAANSPDQCFGC